MWHQLHRSSIYNLKIANLRMGENAEVRKCMYLRGGVSSLIDYVFVSQDLFKTISYI